MAHFSRKRSRITSSKGYSRNGLKHRLGRRYSPDAPYLIYPRSHDLLYHTRPGRRAVRHLERAVMKGADAEELTWPLSKKPHTYYW